MKYLNTIILASSLCMSAVSMAEARGSNNSATGTALARYDAAGNEVDGDNGSITGEGDVCGTCPAPNEDKGVDFKGNDLIVYDGVIRRYQSCGEVELINLNPPPFYGFELGYDSARDLYLISDPYNAVIFTYAANGTQVGSFQLPGHQPAGVTYDPSRDVYWVCDVGSHIIYAVDADSGTIGTIFVVPGTRLAGTGYDAANDAIVYNDRDSATGYWISAADGSVIASYSIPLGGLNNGQGCGVDPLTTNVWLAHYEQPLVYCIFGLGPIAVQEVSWGSIKATYRE